MMLYRITYELLVCFRPEMSSNRNVIKINNIRLLDESQEMYAVFGFNENFR